MAKENIQRLQELLDDYLGPDKEIVKTDSTSLTPPGENYGSMIVKLDITLRNKSDGSEEILYAVAKKIPEDEKLQKVFNIQVTYKNEVSWYTKVVPILREFQKSLGMTSVISCFPEIYGARFNLNNSTEIDEDAVFILENLHFSGFTNIDRIKGFDLETTKLVLRSMAELHAVPLALKLKQPKVFEEKVKIHSHNFEYYDMGALSNEAIKAIASENTKCRSMVPKIKFLRKRNSVSREPFATMTHNDLWTNNTMQKFENGTFTTNKFVDFQVVNYSSPAGDLYFFLFSSVQQKVLEAHLDYLIEYYYENLIRILVDHQCDTTPFNFDAFLEELKLEGEFELSHALIFTTFIVNHAHNSDEQKFKPTVELLIKSTSQQAKEKVWYIMETCINRGWY